MLNKKLQKDKIREILRNNKGLADKNKSIFEEEYVEYKKLRKSVNKRLAKNPETRTVARYNGIQEFLEEAYKHFLLEAQEMIVKEEAEAKKDISEKVSDIKKEVQKPREENKVSKNTKKTVSKKAEVKKSDIKADSNKNNDVKPSGNKEESMKTLKHPDSKITESSKELKSPFDESNDAISNMQIGFFGGVSQETKKTKSKSKTKSTKKKSKTTSSDSTNTNLQMSFLI